MQDGFERVGRVPALVKAMIAVARVYQRAFDDFAGQRNYALDRIPFKREWVLHLDADEIVTPALHAEILPAIDL